MSRGDFYGTEQSAVMADATAVEIVLQPEAGGEAVVLKPSVPLEKGEVIDAGFMSVKELKSFFEQEIDEAKESELLLSLHLKATMMKVSDPIMFGHAIRVYYAAAFEKHAPVLEEIGATPNFGLQNLYDTVKAKLPGDKAAEIVGDFEACYEDRPWLAMVNSDKGITNLHYANDIIIDASMPVVIRDSGKMWNKLGELEDVKCLIPDRCYATMYQEMISYVKSNGQFDVATMGSVANVGLMARKAEEYGSHDKTFEIGQTGRVLVRDKGSGAVYFEHKVDEGDIWRMCQTKDDAIKVRCALATLPILAIPDRFALTKLSLVSPPPLPRTGSAWRWIALGPRALGPSSGSTRSARTTPTSSRR
jgi:isocitrate dehydrogenase